MKRQQAITWIDYDPVQSRTWWPHQMETFSALLAMCAWNSPVTGEFPAQRPVTRSFDIFFDLRLNKRLRKQFCGWWFETPQRPLWRHCNNICYTRPDLTVVEFKSSLHVLYWISASFINQLIEFSRSCDRKKKSLHMVKFVYGSYRIGW